MKSQPKEKSSDELVILELLELIFLNEILRKKLLEMMQDYIVDFNKQGKFDFKNPILTVDFIDYIHQKFEVGSQEILTQFLFNAELFIIKLYKLTEIDKKSIKKSKLKKLRQSFAHRKSSDILSAGERMVLVMGVLWNFNTLYIRNISSDFKSSEDIEYRYSAYCDLILENASQYRGKVKNIKLLRSLNEGLIKKLFNR